MEPEAVEAKPTPRKTSRRGAKTPAPEDPETVKAEAETEPKVAEAVPQKTTRTSRSAKNTEPSAPVTKKTSTRGTKTPAPENEPKKVEAAPAPENEPKKSG